MAAFLLTLLNVLQSLDTAAVAADMEITESVTVAWGALKTKESSKEGVLQNATATKAAKSPLPTATIAQTHSTSLPKHQESTSTPITCPAGLTLLQDVTQPSYHAYHNHNNSHDDDNNNKIPPVLYQTAKDSCISTALYNATIQKWLDPIDGNDENTQSNQLSYRFYDDVRMHRDLYDFEKWQSIFPALPLALQCIDHVDMPVMKADIWRYLVLWEHGGIFADLDVLSSPELMNELLGRDENNPTRADDALFVLVNTAGQQVLSQWFLAVSPRHPLMSYAMEEALFRILQAKRAIPIQHSGPRALYDATDRFLGFNMSLSRGLRVGAVSQQVDIEIGDNNTSPGQHRRRSFRVLPAAYAENNAMVEEKMKAYQMMNMTHYSDQQRSKGKGTGGNKNGGSNNKSYNGATCMEFLGGKLLYSGSKKSGNSRGVTYVYQGKTYSFQNQNRN